MTAMVEVDPLKTQPDPMMRIPEELDAAGFEEAVEIGRGGFGVVYRCVQPALDRTVAVKVLTADLDAENVERFLREQRAMGRLSGHPHIVNVLHVGTTNSGRPFIVMQYHPQGSLDARIREHGPLGWPEALSLGVKIAGAPDGDPAPGCETGEHPAHRLRPAAADRFRYRPDRGLKLPDQINLPTQLTGGDPQTLEAATAAAQEILLVRIRCAAETLSPATSHTGVRVSLSE